MFDSLRTTELLWSETLLGSDVHIVHGRSVVYAFGEKIFLKHAVVTATLVILLYDYICTLDREVELVWMRPRSIATYLFVLNRYLPFVDVTLSLYALKVMLSPEACHRQYAAITYLNTFGVLITQAILILRTIALWQKNFWICCILGIVITGTTVSSFITSKIFLNSLKFRQANPAFFYGCVLESSNTLIKVTFFNILIAETTIVVLTLIRAVTHLRHSNSPWVRKIYKAGFMFYIYLLALSLLNTFFPFFAGPSLKTTFSDPQRALHSMLCNRVIFTIFSPQGPPDQNEDNRISGDLHIFTSRRTGPNIEEGIRFTSILDTYATHEVQTNDTTLPNSVSTSVGDLDSSFTTKQTSINSKPSFNPVHGDS